jgi:uncharacterized protein (DUF305 family)
VCSRESPFTFIFCEGTFFDTSCSNYKEMKKGSMIVSLIVVTLLFACKKEENRLERYKEENETVMSRMIMNMENAALTNDNDLDFARVMIQHHQGGIEMIDVLTKYSKHSQLKETAIKGREMDVASIAKLNEFISSHGTAVTSTDNAEFISEMKAEMTAMHHNMMVGYTSDPDYDFAKMMMAHHQGAIGMAKIELERGSDATAKAEAQEILQQSDSMMELQSFLDTHGSPQNHAKKKNTN